MGRRVQSPEDALAAVSAVTVQLEEAAAEEARLTAVRLDAYCRARLAGASWVAIGEAAGNQSGVAPYRAVQRAEEEGHALARRTMKANATMGTPARGKVAASG